MLQERGGGERGRRGRLWEDGLRMEDGQQPTAGKQVKINLYLTLISDIAGKQQNPVEIIYEVNGTEKISGLLDGKKVTKYGSWEHEWLKCEKNATVNVIKKLVGNREPYGSVYKMSNKWAEK
jgi:hypothetical protein